MADQCVVARLPRDGVSCGRAVDQVVTVGRSRNGIAQCIVVRPHSAIVEYVLADAILAPPYADSRDLERFAGISDGKREVVGIVGRDPNVRRVKPHQAHDVAPQAAFGVVFYRVVAEAAPEDVSVRTCAAR
jgi:hypothetical protein